jgi:DNA-binding protein HU-beta
VNKTELIEHIAKHADISKAAATRALESTIGAVKTTLKKGGSVSLVGFGTFAVGKRAAALAAIPAPALRLKSRQPRFQSSVRARR